MPYNPHDRYFRKAKQEGYRSRAAYKLIELQERFRFIRPGDRIIDLGASPGGWLQVAAKLTGPKGKVLGVDLQQIEPLNAANVLLLQADIASEVTEQQIKSLLAGPADCVISDLAPKLSGIRDTDAARGLDLNLAALRIASHVLRPGGSFLMKSFVNPELETLSQAIKKFFRSVQRTRPEATRRGSSEIYFYAKDFQPL
jgi:23S rRNA (uridine2552-2'-O)-methyltransferase